MCAQDITHDPGHGCDIHAIARRVVLNPPRDLEYVISNRQVAKKRTGWRWEPYTGPSPHDHHAHFAVGQGPDSEPTPPYDDTDPWGIYPPSDQEDEMTPEQAKALIEAVSEIRDHLRKIDTNLQKIADKPKATGA